MRDREHGAKPAALGLDGCLRCLDREAAMELCTCGEPLDTVAVSWHSDLSRRCAGDDHTGCHKSKAQLLNSTGFHWICACQCHLEPSAVIGDGAAKALATWREARRRMGQQHAAQGAVTEGDT